MTALKWLLLIAVVGYGGVLGLMYVFQRALMYFPDPTRTPPAAAGLPQAQEVTLTSSDGEKLIAWYVPPKGTKPLVIYFHGNAGALDPRSDWQTWLSPRRCVDPSGRRAQSGGYHTFGFTPGVDSSGSTSLLWTLLLAVNFAIVHADPVIYTLAINFVIFAAAGLMLYQIAISDGAPPFHALIVAACASLTGNFVWLLFGEWSRSCSRCSRWRRSGCGFNPSRPVVGEHCRAEPRSGRWPSRGPRELPFRAFLV